MTSHRRHNAIGARLPLLLALAGPISAHDGLPAAHHLDAVVVAGHYDNAVDTQRLRDDRLDPVWPRNFRLTLIAGF